MTLQQLEYIVAIDTHRHFGKAADACFVTQPTLSGMVKKLEEELGVVLFDRGRSPVVPTVAGIDLLEQARVVLHEAARLQRMASGAMEEEGGELRVGVIPTLAPYLLPRLLGDLLQRYPSMQLTVEELTTPVILERLPLGTLDVGLMATPLNVPGLRETPLFNEHFMAYASPDVHLGDGRYVLPGDIDPDRLWLLEEGHCMRSQVMQLCELRRAGAHGNLAYRSGSIGSLVRLVDRQGGITIVPLLATLDMAAEARQRLHTFAEPVPGRTISAVTYRHTLKERLVARLCQAVKATVAPLLPAQAVAPMPIKAVE